MRSYKVILDVHWLCNPNLVESSEIYHFLIENGHEITSDPSEADFIIISSCGVTNYMHAHYQEIIKKYISFKKDNAVIIIYGCIVKIAPEKVKSENTELISFEERYKFNDLFYRTKKIEEFPPICDEKTCSELIESKNALYKKIFGKEISSSFSWTLQLLLPRMFSVISKKIRDNYKSFNGLTTQENKIFIEISRGCNYNCSYCAIKKAKGKSISIKVENIIDNLRKNYNPDKTLVLVADDCAMYGVDINSNLIDMVYEINRNFPGCKFDLNFIHPGYLQRFPEEFVKLFEDVNVEAVQIPLQSGSNKILKKMRRYYDIERVLDVVKKIKKVSPKTLLITQCIIGHPGETIIDFMKTLKASKYFDLHYPIGYSDMKGTHSSTLPNKKTRFTIKTRVYLCLIFLSLLLLIKLYKDDFPHGRLIKKA